MSQFLLYFNLGLQHVLNWQAYDHAVFIAVLIVAYTLTEWRKIGWLIGLFALGYTLSLGLSSFEVVLVKSELVEFLIPLTILLTAVFNLFTAGTKSNSGKTNILYVATLFFGMVHGLDFSTYFRRIIGNSSEELLPLLEFALGIGAAQVIVFIAMMLLGFIFQNIFRFSKRDWVLVISSIVIGLAVPMLMDNIF